jgi:hypothetical protein
MPSGGKPRPSGDQYSKQEKETCEQGKDLVKVVWFAETVERLHQNPPGMFIHRRSESDSSAITGVGQH